MDLVALQSKEHQFKCNQEGYVNEEIAGFCFSKKCQKQSAFCVSCVTIDEEKFHYGHKKYCLSFTQIKSGFEKVILQLEAENFNFQALRIQLIEISVQLNKLNLNMLVNKILNVIGKLERFYEHQIKNKLKLFKEQLINLNQKEYDNFRQSINVIKSCYKHDETINVIHQISRLLQDQKQKTYSRIKIHFSQLNEKASQRYFQIGEQLLYQEKFSKAIEYYDQAMKRNSQSSSALIEKAYALEELNKFEEAEKYYEEAFKTKPSNIDECLVLGKLLEMRGKMEEAICCYNFAIDLESKNELKNYKQFILSNKQQKQEKYDKALHLYDQVIKLNSQYANGYLGRAELLKSQNQIEDAIQCCNIAILEIKNKTQIIDIYLYLAQLLLEQEKYEEAKKIYFEANSVDPNKIYIYILQLAQKLVQLKKYEDGFKCFDEVIRVKQNQFLFYQTKADILIDIEQYEAAIQCYLDASKVASIFSQSREEIQNLAKSLKVKEKYKYIIYCIEVLNKMDPQQFQFYYSFNQITQFLKKQKKYKEAIECCDVAIELHPENAQIYSKKGDFLKLQGRYQQAILLYDTAITFDPTNIVIYQQKVQVLHLDGKYQAAILIYDELIKRNPEKKVDIYELKIKYLQELGQEENAIKCYDEAIRLNCDNHQIYKNKGIYLNELNSLIFNSWCEGYNNKIGKYEDSLKCFLKAKKIYPNHFDLSYEMKLIVNSIFVKEIWLTITSKEKQIQFYDFAINLNPKNIEMYLYKAYHLITTENDDSAIECYKQANTHNKENCIEGYYVKKLASYLMHKQTQIAIEYYLKVEKIYPTQFNTYYYINNIAQHLIKNGDFEQAIKCYQEAKLDSKISDICIWLAQTLKQQGNYLDAIKWYDMGSRMSKQTLNTYDFTIFNYYKTKFRLMGESDRFRNQVEPGKKTFLPIESYFLQNYSSSIAKLLIDKKNHDEALQIYQKCYLRNPNFKMCQYFQQLAKSLENQEQYDNSIICYNHVIQIHPQNTSLYLDKSIKFFVEASKIFPQQLNAFNYCLDLAEHLLRDSNIVDAIMCYDQAIKLNPSDLDIQRLLQKTKDIKEQGEFEKEIKQCLQTIQLNQQNACNYFEEFLKQSLTLSSKQIIQDSKSYQDVLDQYDQIAKLYFQTTYIYCYLGMVLKKQFNYGGGNKCSNEEIKSNLLKIQENYEEIFKGQTWKLFFVLKVTKQIHSKARFLEKSKKPLEALKCYVDGINLEPLLTYNTCAYIKQLGEHLSYEGHYEEALKCYNELIAFDPTVCYYKANILMKQKKHDEMLKCYDESINENYLDFDFYSMKINALLSGIGECD